MKLLNLTFLLGPIAAIDGSPRNDVKLFDDPNSRRLGPAVCGDGTCNKGENCVPGDAKCCEDDCGCAASSCSGPPPPSPSPTPGPTAPMTNPNCPAGSTCYCEGTGASCTIDQDCDGTITETVQATCTKGGGTTNVIDQCSSGDDCKAAFDGGGWTCNPGGETQVVTPAALGECKQECSCDAWCKSDDLFGWYVTNSLDSYMASDYTFDTNCLSSSGCPCTMSAVIANTYTIVTGDICDAHNFYPTCEDACDETHCDSAFPEIGSRVEDGVCYCTATVNAWGAETTKDVWSSECVESTYIPECGNFIA